MTNEVRIELNIILKAYDWEKIYDINWYTVSKYRDLSEGFIREFQDMVFWKWISWEQKLSKNFIKEFKDKLDLKTMLREKKISQEFYNELKYGEPLTRFELMDFS